ncbi:MAG: hypothetical protein ACLFR1_03665 [Spirochaetia bacterium]
MKKGDQLLSEIQINYTDKDINNLLNTVQKKDGPSSSTRHYTQNEDFFLYLPEKYTVPSLPIHHDVKQTVPGKEYLQKIRNVVSELTAIEPDVFQGLTYMFSPSEILKPAFFRLYRVENSHYLFILKIDLMYKPMYNEVVQKGTNDFTSSFTTDKLFLEAIFIPLEKVLIQHGKMVGFKIRQLISDTWIGETGRGYFVQGIWIDNDLTKFFSKLFIPDGKRTYPYYPFICKYRTICHSVINLSVDNRKKYLPYLHNAIQFLLPQLSDIQQSIRGDSFSADMPIFIDLKNKIPENWQDIWTDLSVSPYLNEEDQKEFVIEN